MNVFFYFDCLKIIKVDFNYYKLMNIFLFNN